MSAKPHTVKLFVKTCMKNVNVQLKYDWLTGTEAPFLTVRGSMTAFWKPLVDIVDFLIKLQNVLNKINP